MIWQIGWIQMHFNMAEVWWLIMGGRGSFGVWRRDEEWWRVDAGIIWLIFPRKGADRFVYYVEIR